MKAIAFDYNTREILIADGKTVITNNPSIQNGMILLNTKCINVYQPDLGIGFNPINAQNSAIQSGLNRWTIQCKKDRAKTANFEIINVGTTVVESEINYEVKW